MRNRIFTLATAALLAFTALGCSAEDDADDNACAEAPGKAERIELIHSNYQRMLGEDISAEQRAIIEADYEKALEDPCAWGNYEGS